MSFDFSSTNERGQDTKVRKEPVKEAKKEPGTFGKILKTAQTSLSEFLEDQCLLLAGAISYYALLSIFPLFLAVVAIGSLFVDGATQQQLKESITNALPNSGDLNIGQTIDNFLASTRNAAWYLAAFSIITALWAGSGIFDQIMTSINIAWKESKDNRNFFVKVGIRFLMLFSVGLLLAASAALSLILNILKGITNSTLFGINFSQLGFIFDVIVYLVPLTITFFTFAIVYRLSPDVKNKKWRPVFIGAAVGAVLFEAAKFGLGLYLNVFNGADGYAKTYGAIAGLIIFLFYIYVSAAILLLGAEVAAVVAGVQSRKDFEAGRVKTEVKTEDQEIAEALATLRKYNALPETRYQQEQKQKQNPLSTAVSFATLGVFSALSGGNKKK